MVALVKNTDTDVFSKEHIQLAALEVDHRYQRDINEKLVKVIVDNFNVLLCQPLYVGQRDDGTYWLIDGQQRHAALTKLGKRSWDATIVRTNAEQEALLFVDLNRWRKQVGLIDRFKARLFIREDSATQINEMVTAHGFHISPNPTVYGFACIARLSNFHDSGILEEVLDVLKAWEGDEGVTDDLVVGGVGMVIRRALSNREDKEHFSLRRLIQVAEKIDLAELRARAQRMRVTDGGGQWSRPLAFAHALRSAYNTGLGRKRRLSSPEV